MMIIIIYTFEFIVIMKVYVFEQKYFVWDFELLKLVVLQWRLFVLVFELIMCVNIFYRGATKNSRYIITQWKSVNVS